MKKMTTQQGMEEWRSLAMQEKARADRYLAAITEECGLCGHCYEGESLMLTCPLRKVREL